MRSFLHPGRLFNIFWVIIMLLSLVTRSGVDPSDQKEGIRTYSRIYEFDYVSWTLSALKSKAIQASLKVDSYLPVKDQREVVSDYLQLRNETNQLISQLNSVLADPDQEDRQEIEDQIRKDLNTKETHRNALVPFVEQILQAQLNHALTELDISMGGQLIPPVLFRSEPNSYALIISPRDEIRQEARSHKDHRKFPLPRA